MRFCQALMIELYRHLGPDTDVPAGDIGVGAREVGFMAGMMKKLSNSTASVFTGKGLTFGGSLIRPEATGYGTVYFAEEMLKRIGRSFDGLRVSVSGSGNVAQYAIEKAMALGAKVVTVSDSNGTVVDEAGFTHEKLLALMHIKNDLRGRLDAYASQFGLKYEAGKRPWHVPVDVALPCATQNELELADAQMLIKNGVLCVAEGANMPATLEAAKAFIAARVLYAPGRPATPAAWPCRAWNEPERGPPGLDPRGSGRPPARHHARHPRELRAPRPQRARVRELPGRRQHRRLRQGGRRDASARAVLEGPPRSASGASLGGPLKGRHCGPEHRAHPGSATRFFLKGATADRQSRLRVAPVGKDLPNWGGSASAAGQCSGCKARSSLSFRCSDARSVERASRLLLG